MTRSERIGHRLRLRHLRVFLAVVNTGSMVRAAKHLSISQSVVSKAVAELEDLLGVRLFDRSPQGVEPTLYGLSLLKRSIAIFDDLRTSVDEIEFLADPGVGELRIGTTEPQEGIVTTAIERLSRQYSRLDFRVVVAQSRTLIDQELRGRKIDLMVGPLQDSTLQEDLEATPLYDNRLCVVVGMQSSWAHRRKVTLSDLIEEPWCAAPADVASGAAFAEAFRASGLPLPRIVVSSGVNHLRRRMLAYGRFVGISSTGNIYFDAEGGPPLKVLPIELPAPSFTVFIITLKGKTITPAAKLFIDCAREVTKPLTKARPRQAGNP